MRNSTIGIIVSAAIICTLAGCGTPEVRDSAPKGTFNPKYVKPANPRPLPKSRYGNPKTYEVLGKRYHVLNSARNYNKRGIASWYGTKFHGRLTSTREPYDMYAMTAASTELPLPTFVRVTNLENGRQVVVKVNDRGPFAHNRILDLSYAAAMKLGMTKRGTAMVQVTAIDTNEMADAYNSYAAQSTTQVPVPAHPHIYLQAGAFRFPEGASARQQELSRIVRQKVEIVRNHDLYKVIIGPFKNPEQTDAARNKLANQGVNTVTAVG